MAKDPHTPRSWISEILIYNANIQNRIELCSNFSCRGNLGLIVLATCILKSTIFILKEQQTDSNCDLARSGEKIAKYLFLDLDHLDLLRVFVAQDVVSIREAYC